MPRSSTILVATAPFYHAGCCGRRRLGGADDLDPVTVWVADEAEPRAAFAHLVWIALGLDALLLQRGERLLEVIDPDRYVPVGGSQLVGPAVGVPRQLELLVLSRHAEEVVRRLVVAVAH